MRAIMKRKHHILKGDRVIIITGDDKGTIGEVVDVHKERHLIKVANVNMRTHFDKGEGNVSAGLNKREAWIQMSNASHMAPSDNKATKIRRVKDEKGVKIYSRRTGEELRLQEKKTTKVKVEDLKATKEKKEMKKEQPKNKDKDTSFHTPVRKKRGDK